MFTEVISSEVEPNKWEPSYDLTQVTSLDASTESCGAFSKFVECDGDDKLKFSTKYTKAYQSQNKYKRPASQSVCAASKQFSQPYLNQRPSVKQKSSEVVELLDTTFTIDEGKYYTLLQ